MIEQCMDLKSYRSNCYLVQLCARHNDKHFIYLTSFHLYPKLYCYNILYL